MYRANNDRSYIVGRDEKYSESPSQGLIEKHAAFSLHSNQPKLIQIKAPYWMYVLFILNPIKLPVGLRWWALQREPY